MKFVVFPPVDDRRLAAIRSAAGPMQVAAPADANAALREIVDADAFFGKLTPDLLAAATQLKWVQSPTASLEHYLFPELIEHPLRLSNMRGLFSDVIADHVMGYVLCFARQLHRYLRQQINHTWSPIGGEQTRPGFATGPGQVSPIDRAHQHLGDCTLGVVGVGHIGSEIVRRAAAFGMTVLGVDPYPRPVEGVLDDVWALDRLDELLAASDYVVIAAPHTPETEKLFDAQRISWMKSSAVLINIGRGIIVDLQDLTDALEGNVIAGAALDVFETEPLPEDHPLWGMENVILTPHVAAASPRVAERHLDVLLENIRRFVAGEEPTNLVDKTQWF
ncbi:Glycerate dehydrogenase [Maioricimonas rarisocia]|uniref:Glycerate dehydrogenase n=1 Tax=Maioricimonas rarisocia TaxID=2528026 RepID=A0A517Z8V9_9PLAN|nr:D-2-hydroxyacid dehydrogenase [Maioricimonas rarisocia]QDU38905.1 Glycerate dehydrogenase [Maioricimonas rarisocia]